MHTIAGYYIIEHLYESASSLVYRAKRQSDHLPVVLKVLKESYPSPERIAWFKREYEVTHALELPGIPHVYGLETIHAVRPPDNGPRETPGYTGTPITCHPAPITWMMVLEDFGGESLSRLKLAGALSLTAFLNLAIDVTEILGQIHQRHTMHKDINLSNIVCNPKTRQIKIIDFGISTVLSREKPMFRNPNVLEGTLDYMSPEQTGRMNRAMDYRTDFYSLGATLYELLTGQRPFVSDDALELVHYHIARQPTPPQEIHSEIPRELSLVILKLMAKNAEDRYQSAYGLKADLEYIRALVAYNADGQSGARPIPPGRRRPGARFAPGRNDVSDRFLIPQKLYGREAEVERLLAAFERVHAGGLGMVLVEGAGGIGKTSLVQELYRPITLRRGYVVSGKFEQLYRDVPYAAFIQAFRSLMRHILTENEANITAWREKLLQALGSNGQVIIDVIPEVALIIGEQPPVPTLEPAQAKNRFMRAFQQFIQVFTQPNHPLVLFLDDLQWADGASLKLIERVMTTPDSHNLLLIAAFRDTEEGPDYPLWLMVRTIEQAGVSVTRQTIAPLDVAAVTRLIAETLHHPEAQVAPLAELVVQKTGGNPFFLQEFLTSLYVEELIDFDHSSGRWQWDLRQIQSQRITDNVVELMTRKVQRLNPRSQEVLKLAACIGDYFDLVKLAVVWQKPVSETAKDLEPAIMEGMVVPLGDTYKLMTLDVPGLGDAINAEYAFAHNRIQQAAYSLIPQQERQEVHWRIGYLLLLDILPAQREDHIFDIVNQLNYGRAFVSDQEECDELASLNLIAGRKAKASAAYEPAATYLHLGLDLLNAQSWHTQYVLALALHTEATELAYLNADFATMESLGAQVLHHAGSVLDTVPVYGVYIRALIAQSKHAEAVATALHILEQLGIHFPKEPDSEDIATGLEESRDALNDKPIHELLNLPEMTDPYKLAAMRILTSTLNAAYVAHPGLMTLITCKMVALSVNYGCTPMSAHAYASYGLLLCGDLDDIDAGYQFGQLAEQLLERFDARELKTRTLLVVNNFIRHWKDHARETIHPLLETYQIGVEVGDVEFAGLAIYVSASLSFYTGRQLEKLEQDMQHYDTVLAGIKQTRARSMNGLYRQLVLNLLGRSGNPCLLMGRSFHEEQMLPYYLETNDNTSIYYIYFSKLILCYLFDQYPEAVVFSEQAETFSQSAVGSFSIALYHFYDSLARLALLNAEIREGIPHDHESHPADECPQCAHLEKVAANQQKMERWARNAPMNHLHKWYLVEAERCSVRGHMKDAREYYDLAIDLSREHKYMNDEALACELTARFYLQQGRPRIAHVYLHDAHYAYQQWGAHAKVTHLEQRYPQFFLTTEKPSLPQPIIVTASVVETDEKPSDTLDAASVMKASQAIFGEIVLEQLITKLMRVFIENAGAQRGLLLLEGAEDWVVEAEHWIDHSGIQQGAGSPDTDTNKVPYTIVHYVARTRESLILHDARQEHAFVQDRYIQSHRPQSILCMPLVYEQQLIGMLYLENNLATGAFTQSRVETLNLLASQAAISLVHARLYRRMEDMVKARTAELSKTNEALQSEITEHQRTEVALQQAKESAEAANRAKSAFLANMSHELRTPLNAILGFAQIMGRSRNLPPDHRENVRVIHRSGEHLLNLINSVLDLSKIEAGHMHLNENSFDLHRMLDDLVEMFQLRARQKRLLLTFERAPGVPQLVMADEVKLRQILMNLLNNAIKFTHEGGVTLRVLRCDDTASNHHRSFPPCLRFTVEDTGPGIAEDEQKTLFTAFSQTRTGLQSQEGTGLGLSISRKFVQLMGGDLQVRSYVGIGSSFSFAMPIKPPEPSPLDNQPDSRLVIGMQEGQPSYRILVVDDQWDNRYLLVKLLKPMGFAVEEASTGLEAIELVKTWEPHLIWMDVRLPGMDGHETTRRIRALPGGTTIPIIALTASTYEGVEHMLQEAGYDDFLRKPVRDSELFEMIHKHLGVQYVYQEMQGDSSRRRTPGATADDTDRFGLPEERLDLSNQALTPETLCTMPEQWVQDLHMAATLGDIDKLYRLIEQIRPHHRSLAETLTNIVGMFQFEQITAVTVLCSH